MLMFVLVPTVIVGVALVRAYSELDERFLREWARAHALDLTEENRPMVLRYLRTARVLRTWGTLAGLFLPALFSWALGTQLPNFPWFFLGYLVGALCAELSLVRPIEPGHRAASLVPRELCHYLPRRLLWAERGLGLVVLATGLAVMTAPFGSRSGAIEPPARWGVLALMVGGVTFAAGLERVQSWLVRRPQPFTSPSLVSADDAIRAQSVHSLAGSGVAVLLVICSSFLVVLATSDIQVLRWAKWVPGALGFLLAVAACQYYGHRAWRVPRRFTSRPGASSV